VSGRKLFGSLLDLFQKRKAVDVSEQIRSELTMMMSLVGENADYNQTIRKL